MLIESPEANGGYQGTEFENLLRSTAAPGILTIDEAGKISAITAEAQRILPLSNSPSGPSIQDLPASLQAIVREVQLTGQPVVNRQIALPPIDSAPVIVLVTATPSALTRPASLVVMLNCDASTKLEHNLRRLDRLASIGTMSATMAHEIKNALVAVRTFIDLLLEKNPDADLAAVVRREISRVDSIVSQILRFAAPAQPTFTALRLHELLEHSLRLVQHGVENKLISFQREFGAASDAFTGDDHQMEQAFVNLLFNAVEAMPGEGSLTVRTDLVANENRSDLREGVESDPLLRIRITDTGVGIAAEKLNHIFEPFFTTKPTGSGLGLAVTRRIIQEHHGMIRVESCLDHGTTFTVLLPGGFRVR